MRGRLVEDRIEERICKIRVIDGVIANYYPQEELIRCKDCRYFETDHWEKVNEIPIIVAHEICMKWSGGCRTSIDGWCFMAERRTDETD